jgi:hypothetical protein
MRLYAIWHENPAGSGAPEGFVRELRSDVTDGGVALLIFTARKDAEHRAAEYFGYDSYTAARNDGWVQVVEIGEGSLRRPR